MTAQHQKWGDFISNNAAVEYVVGFNGGRTE